MQATRRKALAFLGIGAATAPLAAKEAAEAKVCELASIGVGRAKIYGISQSTEDPTAEQYNLAFQVPGVRDELRSLFFEYERDVGSIDWDLASKKSFSLAAKITYQRQRNVERAIAKARGKQTWKLIDQLVFRAVGTKLLG